MSGNVVNFPRKKVVRDRSTANYLVGYAAGICDVYRNCGEYQAEGALRDSGISIEKFAAAGVEDYDLDTLEEIFKAIGK